MAVKEILIKARKLIENPEKWGKGSSFDRSPLTKCSSEAIMFVDCNLDDRSTAREKLVQVIGRPITEWNDDPNVTHEDVLKAFDKAIEIS